jgi:hypothetical protein
MHNTCTIPLSGSSMPVSVWFILPGQLSPARDRQGRSRVHSPMTRNEKLAAVALAVAALAMIVTLVRGVPEKPARRPTREAERLRAAAGSQRLALDADRKELDDLKQRIAALRKQFEDSRKVDSADTERRLAALADIELGARWKEFQSRLDVLNKYSPKPTSAPQDGKTGP